MAETLSMYMQVYKQKRAVFESLKLFRTWYPDVPISIFSDNGDDFSEVAKAFDATYVPSDMRTVVGPELRTGNLMNLDGIYELFRRVYQHCVSVDTDWVVFISSGTRTLRRIRSFPTTAHVGARTNSFSPELTDHLVRKFGEKMYVYGTSGGGMVNRLAWIQAYENNRDLEEYVQYDPGVALYSDLAMNLMMFINDFEYSVWDEISEIHHMSAPIIRDSAFDHGYKYWYDREWDDRLLEAYKFRTVKDFDERYL